MIYEITQVKSLLNQHFGIKDLHSLQFFLGFEISGSSRGILLNQRKYSLDLLQDAGVLASKHFSTPIKYSLKVSKSTEKPLPMLLVIED